MLGFRCCLSVLEKFECFVSCESAAVRLVWGKKGTKGGCFPCFVYV